MMRGRAALQGYLSMRTLMLGLAGPFVVYVAGCSVVSAWHSDALASVPAGAGGVEALRCSLYPLCQQRMQGSLCTAMVV